MPSPVVDEVLQRRLGWLRWGFAAIALTFVGRLYLLQVVSGADYRQHSNRNSVKERVLEAPRGHVLDRDGQLIVQNRRSFELVYEPGKGVDVDDHHVVERDASA